MVMMTIFYVGTFLEMLVTGWVTLREHSSVSWPSAGNIEMLFSASLVFDSHALPGTLNLRHRSLNLNQSLLLQQIFSYQP